MRWHSLYENFIYVYVCERNLEVEKKEEQSLVKKVLII